MQVFFGAPDKWNKNRNCALKTKKNIRTTFPKKINEKVNEIRDKRMTRIRRYRNIAKEITIKFESTKYGIKYRKLIILIRVICTTDSKTML